MTAMDWKDMQQQIQSAALYKCIAVLQAGTQRVNLQITQHFVQTNWPSKTFQWAMFKNKTAPATKLEIR